MSAPVIFEADRPLCASDVTALMDELIRWWPNRPKPGLGINGGTSHLRWVRDTFATAEVVAPPKPDEPTGLGAVVEDADGAAWVLVDRRDGAGWRRAEASDDRSWRFYSGIAAVKVLSDGWVQP